MVAEREQRGRERAGDREGVEGGGERERERGWIQGRNETG